MSDLLNTTGGDTDIVGRIVRELTQHEEDWHVHGFVSLRMFKQQTRAWRNAHILRNASPMILFCDLRTTNRTYLKNLDSLL